VSCVGYITGIILFYTRYLHVLLWGLSFEQMTDRLLLSLTLHVLVSYGLAIISDCIRPMPSLDAAQNFVNIYIRWHNQLDVKNNNDDNSIQHSDLTHCRLHCRQRTWMQLNGRPKSGIRHILKRCC